MPAYFNISILFQHKYIYKTFVYDFYSHLKKCGLKFLSGFSNESEKEYLFEETTFINQRKFEENFELGFDEDCSKLKSKNILIVFLLQSQRKKYY